MPKTLPITVTVITILLYRTKNSHFYYWEKIRMKGHNVSNYVSGERRWKNYLIPILSRSFSPAGISWLYPAPASLQLQSERLRKVLLKK